MPIAAVAAIGAVASAGAGIYSANKSANAQKDAARSALSQEELMYQQQRADYEQARVAGSNALAAMQYELGLGAKPFFAPGSGLDEDGELYGVGYAGENGAPVFGAEAPPDPLDNPAVTDRELAQLREAARIAGPGSEGMKTPEQVALDNALLQIDQRSLNGPTQAEQDAVAQKAALNTQPVGGTPGIEYQGFQATPGYDFRVSQGQKGVDNKLAQMGLTNSGAAIKATERFRQGTAADEYGTFYNRLAAMAGTGQTATNQISSLGANYANSASNLLMNAGNAAAQGYNNIGSAINGGISNGLSIYGAFGGGSGGSTYGSAMPQPYQAGGIY